ncbi:MmgE/PrpD family protein [Pseudophaeobacter leonis]|uniref:MmgE/PrpD family protein n=1 Tax=Pseudophaeobacter leonis TaxID=1144477 RepID=UPI0030C72290
MQDTLTAQLARFATNDILPSGLARNMARLSALDWLACGVAGRAEPVSQILRAQALSEGGAVPASLFGGTRVPARMAALTNGTISHALDYDDTHFGHIGHPSVAVFPAGFAIAETAGLSLPQVLEAALVGMELSIRVGLWLGRSHYQRAFTRRQRRVPLGPRQLWGGFWDLMRIRWRWHWDWLRPVPLV